MIHRVFEGIDLVYRSTDAVAMPRSEGVIAIDHCREGRLECRAEGEYFYLSAGDISIHKQNGFPESFPTGRYRGMTVPVDLKKVPRCLSCFLEDVNVEPLKLAEKFDLDGVCFFTLRRLPAIEHIFSELYNVPPSIQKGYFKVKILELLLFLSAIEPASDRADTPKITELQVRLAGDVYNYLKENLSRPVTLNELSEQFGVPGNRIKRTFESVYGASPSACFREMKMRAAAGMLRKTERTVLDIAGSLGYDNGSKFAAAFSSVMGTTPADYRKCFGAKLNVLE